LVEKALPNFSVDFTGQSAIITGAGAGAGRAVAFALARCGAAVTINDLNPDRVESVAEEIRDLGGRALAFQADVANRFQVSACIEATRDAFGKIHMLINAAGVYKSGAFDKVDEWDWRRQLDVNLTGSFFFSQLVGRVMADEGGGSIVNIASSAGVKTLESGVGYVASKSAVIAMTRQSARELAPAGIRVNAVCPGNIVDDTSPPAIPNMLQRAGTPDDVAHAALFLCSDAAQFITGQTLIVDGGGFE
jgi:3-oxoacyl-[acyl-carrier protein] reductase